MRVVLIYCAAMEIRSERWQFEGRSAEVHDLTAGFAMRAIERALVLAEEGQLDEAEQSLETALARVERAITLRPAGAHREELVEAFIEVAMERIAFCALRRDTGGCAELLLRTARVSGALPEATAELADVDMQSEEKG